MKKVVDRPCARSLRTSVAASTYAETWARQRRVRNASAVAGHAVPAPCVRRISWLSGKRNPRGKSCRAKTPAIAASQTRPARLSFSSPGRSASATPFRTARAIAVADHVPCLKSHVPGPTSHLGPGGTPVWPGASAIEEAIGYRILYWRSVAMRFRPLSRFGARRGRSNSGAAGIASMARS